MTNVFIDGSAGTTGLKIHNRLKDRRDLDVITLPDALRKDDHARQDALNGADIAFLCLPDAAAIEAADMVTNDHTAVIDTSTAHRTAPDWVYGFAELEGMRDKIASSKRIANPGCHASGFIALVAPLTQAGILSGDVRLTCFSLTGYSGGGKKMIAQYESSGRSELFKAPRQYGLSQSHKHLPEMQMYAHLAHAPAFCPIVADFYSGMEVTVPIFGCDVKGGIRAVEEVYQDAYASPIVHFDRSVSEDGFLSACAFAGRDDMQITVSGNDERILLTARFDNLGKGASGAAIQNMNILLGLNETAGLNL